MYPLLVYRSLLVNPITLLRWTDRRQKTSTLETEPHYTTHTYTYWVYFSSDMCISSDGRLTLYMLHYIGAMCFLAHDAKSMKPTQVWTLYMYV